MEYQFEVLNLTREQGLEESEGRLTELGRDGWRVVSLVPKMGKGESWCLALLER